MSGSEDHGRDRIQQAMGAGFQGEFCDYCKRNFPNSELIIIYTIYNGVEQREYVCDDCEGEARRHEAPALVTDGGEDDQYDAAPESHDEAMVWCRQLHDDMASADWTTAIDESLPKVIAYLEKQTQKSDFVQVNVEYVGWEDE